MKTPNSLVIFGIGALGTLFGSYLNKVAEVTLVGNWKAQIQVLREKGLTVIEPDGTQSFHRLSVTNQITEIPPADLVLILVKSYQTKEVAAQLSQVLRSGGIVITLQNGLGNHEQIAQCVGTERTSLGVTFQGATMQTPGLLNHAGVGATTLVRLPGREEFFQGMEDLFDRAGIPVTLVDNADRLVWTKLAVNAAINPLSALLEVPNGSLIKEGKWMNLMIAAAQEVTTIAAAQQIDLSEDDLAQRVIEVCRATATNHSSMLQDVEKGRTTEVEAICGQVVSYGRRLGIPTPINKKLLGWIQAKESGKIVNLDF